MAKAAPKPKRKPAPKAKPKVKPKLRASELFKNESRFLNGSDVAAAGTIEAAITDVTLESMQDGGKKVVIWLDGHDQGIVVNKTNGQLLAESFGDDLSEWTGQWVLVSTEPKRNPSTGKVGPAIVLQPMEVSEDVAAEENVPFADEDQDVDEET